LRGRDWSDVEWRYFWLQVIFSTQRRGGPLRVTEMGFIPGLRSVSCGFNK
jgi:hypothetical protein